MSTIALLSTPGVGQKTVSRACDIASGTMDDEDFLQPDAMTEVLKKVKERYSRTRLPTHAQLEKGIRQAGAVMDRCAKEGIGVITRVNRRFPQRIGQNTRSPLDSLLSGRCRKSSVPQECCHCWNAQTIDVRQIL